MQIGSMYSIIQSVVSMGNLGSLHLGAQHQLGNRPRNPPLYPEEDGIREEGDLRAVEDRKPGSQPENEAVDEIPGDAEVVDFGTKAKRGHDVVQEGHPVQTEPGGSQAGHNRVTGGQHPVSHPLPTQHSNYEAILQHSNQ